LIVSESAGVRLVLDTNVIISACLKPDGLERRVVEMGLSGEARIFVTAEIQAEYREVMSRAKFRNLQAEAAALLVALDSRALLVAAEIMIDAALDPDDNRFLECAVAAQADFLVTGNLRHYPSEYAGVRVVNARALLSAG
jgi:putative PIN family toxin of toxin-antitoxin system